MRDGDDRVVMVSHYQAPAAKEVFACIASLSLLVAVNILLPILTLWRMRLREVNLLEPSWREGGTRV